MKVPSEVTPRTRPSSQGLSYLRPADVDMSPIARGLQALGGSLQQLEERNRQQALAANRTKMMLGLDDLQIRAQESMNEQVNQADPADSNFRERADQTVDNYINEFVAGLPAEVQEEARVRAGAIRIKHSFAAMQKENELRTNFFLEAAKRKATNAEVNLSSDPSRPNYDLIWKDVSDTIDGLEGLSPVQREELKRKEKARLSSILYKQEAKKEVAAGKDTLSVIKHFEGWSATAYSDKRTSTGKHDAWRIGYGSDTITRADGSVIRVQPGMKISRADAERDLARRTVEFQQGIVRDIGQQRWQSLSPGAQAALTSVAYNYGSLPDSVVRAAETGDNEALAQAVASLSANKDRRRQEASMIRSGGLGRDISEIDNDPVFDELSLEQRYALREDAQKDFNAELTERNKLQNQRIDAGRNELYLGLANGRYGQADIQQALDAGILDYDAWNKARGIFTKYTEDTNNAGAFAAFMQSEGATFNPMSDEQRKQFNAYVGPDGLNKLQQMDQGYWNNVLMPAISKAQDVPTDVAGLLTGMIRSNDPRRFGFALDTLAQIRDSAPAAFSQRFSNDTQLSKNLDLWQDMRGVYDAETMQKIIQGGETAEMRSAKKFYDEQATKILTDKNDPHFLSADKLLNDLAGGWFSSAPPLANYYSVQPALISEYTAHFKEMYAKFNGNAASAHEAAIKAIGQTWGPSPAELGLQTFMKWPPEKAGYQPLYGSFNWIDRNIRDELKLQPGETYQLIADDQTEREVSRFQSGAGAPPSYVVIVRGLDGVDRPAKIPGTNTITRLNFVPTQEQLTKHQLGKDIERERAWLSNAEQRMREIFFTKDGLPRLDRSEVDSYLEEIRTRRQALDQQQLQYDQMLAPEPDITPSKIEEELDPLGGYKPVPWGQ